MTAPPGNTDRADSAHTSDNPADPDDLSAWDLDPTPAYPHVALLLAGSLLVVVLACIVPLFVLQQVRVGLPAMVLAAVCGATVVVAVAPALTVRVQSPGFVTAALLMFDLIPVTIASTARADVPVRQWAALLLIPVLLAAATLHRRRYQLQLAIGSGVGVVLMVAHSTRPAGAVVSAAGFVLFLSVCARLTRLNWSSLHREFERLQRASRTDELTGLLNRRGFVEQFTQLRRRAMDRGSRLGMVMIDIDHFSRINAEYGHAKGDAVLVAVCDLVRRLQIVQDGLVARIGGEELLVVVPGSAAEVANRVRAALALGTVHRGLTVSMGAFDADPAACTDVDALWRLVGRTDDVMYQAKTRGRNQIVVADESSTDAVGAPDAESGPGARAVTGSESAAAPTPHAPDPPVDPDRPRPRHRHRRQPDRSDQAAVSSGVIDVPLIGVYCVAVATTGTVVSDLVPSVPAPDGALWAILGTAGLILRILLLIVGFGMLVFGVPARDIATGERRPGPGWFTLPVVVLLEASTLVSVVCTPNLGVRLLLVCLLAVPVLVTAHTVRHGRLPAHFLLVFVGVGIAALPAGEPMDSAWLHRTLYLGVLISTAPAVLSWLRRRRESANARLQRLANQDPLTLVRNRTGLEHAVLPVPPAQRLTFLAVNIDGFKALNDTYGHVVGDQALRAVADALTATMRDPAATVARTGGDRFVAVFSEPMESTLITRLHRAVAAFSPALSVSVGSAAGRPATAAELWELVAAAEFDLMRARAAGSAESPTD